MNDQRITRKTKLVPESLDLVFQNPVLVRPGLETLDMMKCNSTVLRRGFAGLGADIVHHLRQPAEILRVRKEQDGHRIR